MVTLISKDSSLVDKLSLALDKSTKDLLNLDTETVAKEFLSQDRAIEQVELFKSEINKFYKYDLKGKKLLEIGSAVGTFLITARKNYNIEAYGVEPSDNEFSSFEEVSNVLLKENNLSKDIVINSVAEKLPFGDNSFDLIYSTNVLEHVKDPKMVLNEAIRVLKPGGFLQFVIPNYFSFWEGHYGILWPCLTNRPLAKLYAKLIGRNPVYIDTLQLISPFYLKKILNSFENKIEILSWGKDIFKNRLATGNYSDWASLKRIRPIVSFIQKLKVASLIANIVNAFEMYTPIILTIKKV